jgi:hypothetical protein
MNLVQQQVNKLKTQEGKGVSKYKILFFFPSSLSFSEKKFLFCFVLFSWRARNGTRGLNMLEKYFLTKLHFLPFFLPSLFSCVSSSPFFFFQGFSNGL